MKTLFDEPLRRTDDLLRRFEEIHDAIYANDGLTAQEALNEFAKLLFVKVHCEQSDHSEFVVHKSEWEQIKSEGRAASFEQRLKRLFADAAKVHADLFSSDDFIRLSAYSAGLAVAKLQDVSLTDSTGDANGLAFQKFLTSKEKSSLGQYFTPEPVVNFCVEFLAPRPGEKILDPACGAGGFLLSAARYMAAQSFAANSGETNAPGQFYGIEINKSIARLARMKMILELGDLAEILCGNALEDREALMLQMPKYGEIDVILTNPPFGVKINDRKTLARFDLGRKWTKQKYESVKTAEIHRNQNSELLFIERCLDMLKEGGRSAIILPNGNLENPSLHYLRNFIRQRANIIAVVNLPQETFIPHGTGVKTSILFLQKTTNPAAPKIFFGKIRQLGYSGNKNGKTRYRTDASGNAIIDLSGARVIEEDFSDTLQKYRDPTGEVKESDSHTFWLPADVVDDRLDYGFHAPEARALERKLRESGARPLGELCEIVKRKSAKLKMPNLEVSYIELSDAIPYTSEIARAAAMRVHQLPSRASYEVQAGDLVTAVAGNSVGSRQHVTALVTPEYSGAICTNGFRVLRNPRIDVCFLLYYLRSDSFLKQMLRYRTGAAIPVVSEADLAEILVRVPDESVIREISDRVRAALTMREESRKILSETLLDF